MELKRYQERVLSEVRAFLGSLVDERKTGNTRFASQGAWDALQVPLRLRTYRPQKTGAGGDLPTFCLKVPTGGGKTLLATQVLGIAYKTLLSHKNGCGLVLWVVPSDQIYQDTLKALRNRHHFYREALEYALSTRIQVWEKHEVARLTPVQLAADLNVLLIKLQGTNRQDKESLKFFRDSGGNIVQHFPAEDDPAQHKALKQSIRNLEMLEEDASTGSYLAKTSIANLVRLCEPVVILDERQKASSVLAQNTLHGFNPSLIVELSATPPPEANILSTVSGEELLLEQMIKLPINVASSGVKSWEQCLTQARDKQKALDALARKNYRETGRYIRPIVLVQVERVGKDQRDSGHIHSEQVREYLIRNLGISSEAVKVKTSEANEIENLPLLSEDCPVEWIITKAALQEGWDCPFAYVLVSLSNTRAQMSMTQLVGRVLRQPYAQKTDCPDLNESYVYCLHQEVGETIRQIRNALHKEGYEGDAATVIDRSDPDAKPPSMLNRLKPQYTESYRDGAIYLPRFCVQVEEDAFEPLDYYGHLLAKVETRCFDFDTARGWDFTDVLKSAKESFFQVLLNTENDALEQYNLRERRLDYVESDAQAKAWLVANLDMEWYSAKRLREIVEEVAARLTQVERLALVRFHLRDRIYAFIRDETDKQTEDAFKALHGEGRVKFFHQREDCRFEMRKTRQMYLGDQFQRSDRRPPKRNAYEVASNGMGNLFEEDVAQGMDNDDDVYWWHRNPVGEFKIQGWRRNAIYPDFIAQLARNGRAAPVLLALETKGAHLEGNADTDYKKAVGEFFSDTGNRVPWQAMIDSEEATTEHRFGFKVIQQGEYLSKAYQDVLRDLKAQYLSGLEPITHSIVGMRK